MPAATLLVRFAAELFAIGALGYWGFNAAGPSPLRLVLGLGAPALLIVAWALVIAPNASSPLTQPQRDLVGTVVLLVAAAALGLAGQPTAALVFAAVVVVDWILMVLAGPQALDVIRPTGAR